MKLTSQEISEITKLLNGIHLTDEAKQMKKYIQHAHISTYHHVLSVMRFSFYLNKRLRLGASERELVRGAFLHDFYLYDWHQNSYFGRLHGLHHPAAALKNADRHYPLTPKERNIIESHMWPLTLSKIPKCREALIVCIADKICSSYEILFRTKKFIV